MQHTLHKILYHITNILRYNIYLIIRLLLSTKLLEKVWSQRNADDARTYLLQQINVHITILRNNKKIYI